MAKKATKKRTGARAVLYCRVSTEHQVSEGSSLGAQQARLEAYAASASLDVEVVLIEQGVSGSIPIGERPEGSRLVSMIENGEVDHVIFLKLDRAFRNAADALNTIEAWDKAGVGVHFVDHGGMSLNTTSALGKMLLTVLSGMAEFERNLAAERTAAALAHKKASGQVYGPTPFGQDRIGNDLYVNQDEMNVLERMKEWHAEGASLREIARRLNEAGVQSKKGGAWYASSVRSVLSAA